MSPRFFGSVSALAPVVAGFLLGHSPGWAQPLAPGDRIRVVPASGGAPIAGDFVRHSADSVWLQPSRRGKTISVGLGSGVRLDRSVGSRSHAGLGALVGAGVGAAVTIFFLSRFCGGDTLCDGDEQVRAAAIFGLPSVALGAGIGALIRTERWTPVPAGSLGFRPGLQFGVQFGW